MTKKTKKAQPDLSHLPCAIYIRVSTEDQGEQYSPKSQLRNSKLKASQLGWEVDESLIFTDERSGKDTDRPAFKKMMELVKAQRVRGVIVFTIDRLSRDVIDAIITRRTCESYGVALEFVNLTVDDTPIGEFMYTLIAAIGQLERRTIMQRTIDGRAEAIAENHIPGGGCPFGYRYLGKSVGERGRLEIREDTAAVVRTMFALQKSGHSLHAITRLLNADSVPCPRSIRWNPDSTAKFLRKGERDIWNRNSVVQILRNPVYVGKYTIGKGTNHARVIPVPPIIDEELFEAAAFQRAKNRESRVGRPSIHYLLRGMFWCAKCGKRMTTWRHTTHPYYMCCSHASAYAYRAATKCAIRQAKCHVVEPIAFDAIWDTITDASVLWKYVKAYHDQLAAQSDLKTQDKLAAKLAKAKKQVERAQLVLFNGDTDYATAKKHLKEAERQLLVAQTEYRSCRMILPLPPKAAIESLCRKIAAGKRCFETYEERRGLLERFVDRITWNGEVLEIHGKISLDLAAVKSEGSEQKNCIKSVANNYNSSVSIPFVITRKVA